MKQRRRIYYSVSQRAEIWDRWKREESMNKIVLHSPERIR